MVAVSRGTSHVIGINSAGTTSVAIQNAVSKATVTHSETHTTTAQWVCLEADNGALVAIGKRLWVISR